MLSLAAFCRCAWIAYQCDAHARRVAIHVQHVVIPIGLTLHHVRIHATHTHSLIHSVTPSLIDSFAVVHSFTHIHALIQFNDSPIHPLTHSPTHPLIHSFTLSAILFTVLILLHLLHALIYPLTLSFTPSFIHSVIHSFIHSLRHHHSFTHSWHPDSSGPSGGHLPTLLMCVCSTWVFRLKSGIIRVCVTLHSETVSLSPSTVLIVAHICSRIHMYEYILKRLIVVINAEIWSREAFVYLLLLCFASFSAVACSFPTFSTTLKELIR